MPSSSVATFGRYALLGRTPLSEEGTASSGVSDEIALTFMGQSPGLTFRYALRITFIRFQSSKSHTGGKCENAPDYGDSGRVLAV